MSSLGFELGEPDDPRDAYREFIKVYASKFDLDHFFWRSAEYSGNEKIVV
jgi:hypothetical protein